MPDSAWADEMIRELGLDEAAEQDGRSIVIKVNITWARDQMAHPVHK